MPNAAPPQAANHLLMSVGERVSDGGGRGRACGGRDPRVFVCTVGLLRLRYCLFYGLTLLHLYCIFSRSFGTAFSFAHRVSDSV